MTAYLPGGIMDQQLEPLDPRDAVQHLKTLIDAAVEADDLATVQRLLREMQRIVDTAQRPNG